VSVLLQAETKVFYSCFDALFPARANEIIKQAGAGLRPVAKAAGFCNVEDAMTDDLLRHHLKIGMSVGDLQTLWSPSSRKENQEQTWVYEIMTDYGSDIDPFATKTLEVSIQTAWSPAVNCSTGKRNEAT
jgi:hypothetical protein